MVPNQIKYLRVYRYLLAHHTRAAGRASRGEQETSIFGGLATIVMVIPTAALRAPRPPRRNANYLRDDVTRPPIDNECGCTLFFTCALVKERFSHGGYQGCYIARLQACMTHSGDAYLSLTKRITQERSCTVAVQLRTTTCSIFVRRPVTCSVLLHHRCTENPREIMSR